MQGDIRHSLPVIDVHQLIEQWFARLFHRDQKAKMPRLRRQVLDERKLTRPVFGLQRANQHVAAVIQRRDPVIDSEPGHGRLFSCAFAVGSRGLKR
ncbi:hypothetical protein AL046_24245 [Pseudomonas syringae pv. avii]|nr:hypothetical protein AL046_24245 [Pseudomonas syringae pv. avii]